MRCIIFTKMCYLGKLEITTYGEDITAVEQNTQKTKVQFWKRVPGSANFIFQNEITGKIYSAAQCNYLNVIWPGNKGE